MYTYAHRFLFTHDDHRSLSLIELRDMQAKLAQKEEQLQQLRIRQSEVANQRELNEVKSEKLVMDLQFVVQQSNQSQVVESVNEQLEHSDETTNGHDYTGDNSTKPLMHGNLDKMVYKQTRISDYLFVPMYIYI